MNWKLVLCGVICVVVLATQVRADEEAFKLFMGKYGKCYADADEYNHRLSVFKENQKFIREHNANPDRTHDVAINHLADLTHEEYVDSLQSELIGTPEASPSAKLGNKNPKLPTNLDWRSTGNVAPVQNSGYACRAGVSYLTVANQVASVLSIDVKSAPVLLSSQQLLDCANFSGSGQGCEGGWPYDLYDYVQSYGLEKAKDYPFTGNGSSDCLYNEKISYATITGTVNVTTEDDLQKAVALYGPTIALFDAAPHGFQFYSHGIFSSPQCNASQVDYLLLVVGYGVDPSGTEYWIAQNIWGKSWGMNGYVNIKKGVNMCGIATQSTYVTGAKLF